MPSFLSVRFLISWLTGTCGASSEAIPALRPPDRMETLDITPHANSMAHHTNENTPLTSGLQSSVNHPGPAQIRTISLEDVPSMLDKLGDMLFDKVMMEWVKDTAQATGMSGEMRDYLPDEPSEDKGMQRLSMRRRWRGGRRHRPKTLFRSVPVQRHRSPLVLRPMCSLPH